MDFPSFLSVIAAVFSAAAAICSWRTSEKSLELARKIDHQAKIDKQDFEFQRIRLLSAEAKSLAELHHFTVAALLEKFEAHLETRSEFIDDNGQFMTDMENVRVEMVRLRTSEAEYANLFRSLMGAEATDTKVMMRERANMEALLVSLRGDIDKFRILSEIYQRRHFVKP